MSPMETAKMEKTELRRTLMEERKKLVNEHQSFRENAGGKKADGQQS